MAVRADVHILAEEVNRPIAEYELGSTGVVAEGVVIIDGKVHLAGACLRVDGTVGTSIDSHCLILAIAKRPDPGRPVAKGHRCLGAPPRGRSGRGHIGRLSSHDRVAQAIRDF